MAIILTENCGKTIHVRLSGKLTHADYQDFVPEFERLIKLHGKPQHPGRDGGLSRLGRPGPLG